MKKNKHTNFECVVDKQTRFSKYLEEEKNIREVEGNSDDHKRDGKRREVMSTSPSSMEIKNN